MLGLHYEPLYRFYPVDQDYAFVVSGDFVSTDDGTGIVHIAPGCGAEDFELARIHDLPVLTPVDESGRFYDEYGWLHGLSTAESAGQIAGNLAERGLLLEEGVYEHRYPECWRCHTPLIFRITDDWFLAADPLRQQLLDANASVEWTPEYMGKRMDDWLRNMGDWNISRKRYFGLPLPFYPCPDCGTLTVLGSLDELRERALRGLEQLQAKVRELQDRREQLATQSGDDSLAKQKLREVERDLRYFNAQLERAAVVDPAGQPRDAVHFGAVVKILDEQDREHRFCIVGDDEADVLAGKISWASPLAKAMIGARVGDTVMWRRPAGDTEVRIAEISHPDS